MCYPLPGPRCSYHASKVLKTYQEEILEAQDADEYDSLRKKLDKAQRVYDSTPQGQTELAEELLRNANDTLIAARLERGQKDRAKQEADYERAKGLPPQRSVRRGCNNVENAHILEELVESRNVWFSRLTDDEKETIHAYTVFNYENVNQLLRGEEDKLTPNMKSSGQEMMVHLDSAIAKAPVPENPRQLFRYFKVPGVAKGQNNAPIVNDFVNQEFQIGQEVTFPSYLSTSADADFMVYRDASNSIKNRFFIMEITTKKGGAIHKEGSPNNQSILYHEREVILPRGMTFEVAGIHENVTYESTKEYSDFGTHVGEGQKRKFTVVQLIEKDDEST